MAGTGRRADRSWSRLARRLRRLYRSGPSQLQYPLNGSLDVRERHLNGESLRPFADREKRADPSGVDEPDFSEVEYEPANSVLGKEPLDLGLEHERRGHVELAGGLDLDGCTVTPWRHGVFCVGCCWALMLVMFAAGVASLVWMALLTTVMVHEKTRPRGARVVPVTGLALLGAGATTLLHSAYAHGALG